MNTRPNRADSAAKSPKSIPIEEPLRRLASGISQLDADRASAYAELATVRSAHAGALARREQIYARKYGAEHPRVAEVRARRENSARLTTEIRLAQAQAATPTPTTDPESYVLHGFVRNRQRQPLAGLTVSLHDEKGTWIRELGYSCTDEHGHFLLRYPATPQRPSTTPNTATAAEAKPQETLQLLRGLEINTGASQPQAATTTGANQNRPDRKQAWIRVHNRKQELLHRDRTPLEPQLGQVDYREILLDGDGPCCAPPPGAANDTPPPAPPSTPTTPPRPPAGTAVQAPAPTPPGSAPIPAASPIAVKPPSQPPATPTPTPTPATSGVGNVSAKSMPAAKSKRAPAKPKSPPR